ncbi:hypothetical protein ACFOWM_03370 [Ferruginibacter yonginensis]|uniref:Uncharacterized protein n=1 Tax=Ferruginibacter yonginensis TaxID=1310416 RepID=A0ABV8QQ21_9BACT
MLQLFLRSERESGWLDLLPGTVLDMERTNNLFDEDLTSGEFSIPIDMPWTDNNRRKLGFIERLGNVITQSNYFTIDVFDSGYPELQFAKLTITEKDGKLDYTKGTFKASISGNKGLFGSKIKNKKLRDLSLGGTITFNSDCRDFATDHAKGLYPQYDYIGFAPVGIESFFDTSKSYNNEFLVKDTVNYIVSTGAGLNDWQFGRPKSSNPNQVATSGTAEYIDYRTIPFFKLKYVFEQACAAVGYSIAGDVLDNPSWNDLFIFNTTAIEFYSVVAHADYTRKIFPADHVPDITVAEFLKAICSFFNLEANFSNNQILLSYRQQVFTNRRVIDISSRCAATFKAIYQDETDKTGFTLDYEWDANDDYRNDRVKDINTKTMVGTVSTFPNLATLNIGRSFTTDDIAFVESENMYYNVANATTTPIKWDAWSERLGEYKQGEGGDSYKIGMSTLCSYVALDPANALYIRRPYLGCRQNGSYYNNKYQKIKKDFSLRIFFIKKQVINGNEVPMSMNHTTTNNGVRLNNFSLVLEGNDGLLKRNHQQWIEAKQKKQSVTVPVLADKQFLKALNNSNTVQLNNVLFLHEKTEDTIPLQSTVNLLLRPL